MIEKKDTRARFGPFAVKLSFTAGSVIFSLIGLEIASRVIDGEPVFSVRNFIVDRVDRFTEQLSGSAQFDEQLGWVPSSDFEHPLYHFAEYGIRLNRSTQTEFPSGGVLAVGDSFTAGAEVADEATWPALLEEMLNVPIANGGVGGYGVDQTILRARQLLPIVEPKYLIVGIMVGDISRAEFKIWSGGAKPYFVVEDGALVRKNEPVPRIQGTRADLGWLRAILGRLYLSIFVAERVGRIDEWVTPKMQVRAHDYGEEVSCLLLEDLKARLDSMGVELAVFMQYAGIHIEKHDRTPKSAARVLSCARKLGVVSIDSFPALRQVYLEGAEQLASLYMKRGHMSPAGNRLMAEILQGAISGWVAADR